MRYSRNTVTHFNVPLAKLLGLTGVYITDTFISLMNEGASFEELPRLTFIS